MEIRSQGEDSAVDARLRFTVKKWTVVERLEDEALVDAVDHFAGLLAGRIEAEVHQDDQAVERNEQASVLLRPAPVASGRLEGEKFGPPTCGRDTGPLDRNRVRVCIGEISHDLPSNGRVRIKQPFEGLG